MGRGIPLQPTRGSGERRELRQRGSAENGFWRILKATERSFFVPRLYDNNRRGQFALASPSHVIYAHGPCVVGEGHVIVMTMIADRACRRSPSYT